MARKRNEDKASSFGLFSMAAICAGLMVYVPNEAAKWSAGAIGAATALAGANRLREEREQDRKRKAADIPSGIHGTAAF